jgi:hypothetical protein
LDPQNPRTLGEAGYVLASTGQTAEARQLLATLGDMARRGTATAWTSSAMVEIGLGERDQALESLRELLDPKNGGGFQGLGQYHAFDELSADPRYQELLAKTQ